MARVGISNYAQQQLGEIIHIEFPSVGKTVEAYRYVRGKDITDLMDIVRSRIKQEDDAIERERLEKERLKAERKAVRKERKLN